MSLPPAAETGPAPPPSRFARALRATPVTWTLIGLNLLAFLASTLSAAAAPWTSIVGALGGQPTPLHLWGAMLAETTRYSDVGEVGGVADGQYWRLVTSMFLHFGVVHIALNLLSLWVLGRDIETIFGGARFLALYLICGLAGSVSVYWFAGDQLSAGASGAIFGLFGALVPILLRMKRGLASIVVTIGLNLAITFTVPNISIAAHLGGLVMGLILGAVLARWPRWPRAIVVASLVALGVLLLATVVRTVVLTLG